MRPILILLLVSLVSCSTTSPVPQAQDAAARDIDQFVENVLRELPDIPSIGVAIVRDGEPYHVRAFGYADVANKVRADAHTGYYIGSTTKAYTGLACAILAQRGLIDLDAPITRYLPELTMRAPLDASKLTLRSFLTHTSAIDNDAIVFRTAFSGDHTPEQLVTLLSLSRPGKTGFDYDNLGYVVASLVIERVTGKPWQRVLDELVFTPLGMTDTTAYMSEADQSGRLASPYEVNRQGRMERLTFVKNDRMMHAAGGIVTTLADMARWLEANINEGRVGGRQRIPASAFREAQRQQAEATVTRGRFQTQGYGFGWYQAKYGPEVVLFHGGGFEGWRSTFSFMPERKIGVAVVTNHSGNAAITLVANYIYDRLLNQADSETNNAAELQKLKTGLQQARERFLTDVANRAKRRSMLRQPHETYVGVYENPLYGTISIEQRGPKLFAALSNLTSEIEAFTEPETARVEFIPGTGEVLWFIFEETRVTGLKWRDEVFQKIR